MDATTRKNSQLSFLLITALGACAYFYICLYSFSPLDQTPFSLRIPSLPLSNRGGVWGALISAWSFYFFGLAAFLLPLPFLCPLTFAFKRSGDAPSLFASACGAGLSVVLVCLLLRESMPQIDQEGFPLRTAGLCGDWLYLAATRYLGPWGYWLLLGTFFLLAVQSFASKSLFLLLFQPLRGLWATMRDQTL